MTAGDPWMRAWRELEAFLEGGATEDEALEYARELARGLPDLRDPVVFAQHAEALVRVMVEILGDTRGGEAW